MSDGGVFCSHLSNAMNFTYDLLPKIFAPTLSGFLRMLDSC